MQVTSAARKLPTACSKACGAAGTCLCQLPPASRKQTIVMAKNTHLVLLARQVTSSGRTANQLPDIGVCRDFVHKACRIKLLLLSQGLAVQESRAVI
jgi:hypothetical protein